MQLTQTVFVDGFDERILKSEWEWANPAGDSSYTLSSEAGWLEVQAARGSSLSRPQFDAPRLLQTISGDFAVEVKIKAASEDVPSVGGLLIWKDEAHFIRLERGLHGKDEIGFLGNTGDEPHYFGRGMLASDVLTLRLERTGDRVTAHCSDDGTNWFTCGTVRIPVGDPIQVGIYAIGLVSTGGDWRAMTATRFVDFRVMR